MENFSTSKPPYGAFPAFLNFIQELNEHPLPQVIDRSVMGSRNGTSRSEIMSALRFFRLVDDDRRPTQAMRELVGDPSKERIAEMVKIAYAPVIDLDLMTATRGQLDEALLAMGAGGMLAKARAFFLIAATQSGIPLGRVLQTATRPGAPRKRRMKVEAPVAPAPPPAPTRHPFIEGLLTELPPAGGSWKAAKRQLWIEMAERTIDMLFTVEDPQNLPQSARSNGQAPGGGAPGETHNHPRGTENQ